MAKQFRKEGELEMNPTLTVKLENDIGLHTSPGLHQDTSTKNDQNGK